MDQVDRNPPKPIPFSVFIKSVPKSLYTIDWCSVVSSGTKAPKSLPNERPQLQCCPEASVLDQVKELTGQELVLADPWLTWL